MFGDLTGERREPPRDRGVKPQSRPRTDWRSRIISIRWWWWVIGAGAALVILALVVFFSVGNWLVVQDSLAKADAIVVINGQMPERAREAAAIYKQNYAAEIWITRPEDDPTDELRQLGIPYVGEAFYDEKILMQLGVPPESIRIMNQAASNTEDEVAKIGAQARTEGLHKLIVVTSRAHTRRVKTIWWKLLGPNPELVVRYAPSDPYDGSHWWRHTQDALDVLRETTGILNAWCGFPLGHRALLPRQTPQAAP